MQIAAIPFPEISPELFSIEIGTFRFALRWYALAYIAGILIGWRLCVSLIRNAKLWRPGNPPMTSAQFEDLMIWIVLGVILGGRLGFILFYQPAFYLQNPLEILKVWQGGMSFHGGFLGVSIAVLVYCIRYRFPFFSITDLLALAAPIGLFFGRVANFINNELWGRPTEVWWGVVFPGELAQSCPGIEGLCARHPSQLYEAVLEGIVLGGLLLYLALKHGSLKRPGALTGVFLTGYGIARSLVELFRQPDAQFITLGNPIGHVLHFETWGVTMGQLLSLPMVMVGLGLICMRPRGHHASVS